MTTKKKLTKKSDVNKECSLQVYERPVYLRRFTLKKINETEFPEYEGKVLPVRTILLERDRFSSFFSINGVLFGENFNLKEGDLVDAYAIEMTNVKDEDDFHYLIEYICKSK